MTKVTLVLIALAITANAQDKSARTWADVGFGITNNSVEVNVGTAYDLRHNFQVRTNGKYRNNPIVPKLFVGDEPITATSEMVYGGSLVYHTKVALVGAGLQVTRHFYDKFDESSVTPDYSLYNSSVNPTIVLGTRIGRNGELIFTKYLTDTYSYSKMRGIGFDYGYTHKLSGYLHLHTGVKFNRWTFREGTENYDEHANEISFFVGFRFQKNKVK